MKEEKSPMVPRIPLNKPEPPLDLTKVRGSLSCTVFGRHETVILVVQTSMKVVDANEVKG